MQTLNEKLEDVKSLPNVKHTLYTVEKDGIYTAGSTWVNAKYDYDAHRSDAFKKAQKLLSDYDIADNMGECFDQLFADTTRYMMNRTHNTFSLHLFNDHLEWGDDTCTGFYIYNQKTKKHIDSCIIGPSARGINH